jgi:UDP-2,3-diacylglucosamine pyrophosphatase LpxH
MARTVILGDLHLDYGNTNTEKVRELLDRLRQNRPDRIVLGGDIYELWRRDMAGVMWETSWFTDAVDEMGDKGTEIVYLVGNHDSWKLIHTTPNSEYLAQPQLDYWFSDGGEEFFVTHGHKYEPVYNPVVNDALSVTDDFLGSLSHKIWANRPLPGNLFERAGLLALGPAASYLDIESTSKSRLRIETIHAGIQSESGDSSWGFYGHTHVPFVSEEQKIANWGSFTSGRASYLVVEDGNVQFVDMMAES